MKKKHGLTIKVPLSELETESVLDKVKKHLQQDSEHAFTRQGLMIDAFGYKEDDINASFKDWPQGAPTLYTRIGKALDELEKKGLVKSTRQGKKYLYWWHQK